MLDCILSSVPKGTKTTLQHNPAHQDEPIYNALDQADGGGRTSTESFAIIGREEGIY